METVILTVHLLIAFALIIVVLLQRSEGGGLGIGGGGGGGMSGRSAATALSKVTWMLGVGFVITSLTLTVIAARDSGAASVLDRIGAPTVPATEGTGAPGLGSDLLPPILAPAAPPALDSPAAPPALEQAAPPAADTSAPSVPKAPAVDAPAIPEVETPAPPETGTPEAAPPTPAIPPATN